VERKCPRHGPPARKNTHRRRSYTYLDRYTDVFLYRHPESVIVFAAGNSGDSEYSVTSPSTSKNSISVGASGEATILRFFLIF
jgi:subtilisin family serine protease